MLAIFEKPVLSSSRCVRNLLPSCRDTNIIAQLRNANVYAAPTVRTDRFRESANSFERLSDNSAYVRFKGQFRVYINAKISDDRNITEMSTCQVIFTSGVISSFITNR
jgi:hypothetical protein